MVNLSKDRNCDNSLTGTRAKNFSISMRGNKKKVIRNKIELFARPSEQQHYANVLFLPSNHHHLCMGETKKKPKKNPDTAKNLNWIFLQQLGFDCTLFSLKLWF